MGRITCPIPRPDSFKRTLFEGMPDGYKYHLALYDGISAKHSSLDDILERARHYERTLTSLRAGRRIERQQDQRAPMRTDSRCANFLVPQERQHPRTLPAALPKNRDGADPRAQVQCPTPKPTTGDQGKAPTLNPPAPRGDTSKLTCYKCGKTGHISSDPKCPQYRKPEQRQIYAAHVVDDRLDSGQPDHPEASEDQEECPETDKEGNLDENLGEQPEQGEYPDGSQYNDEDASYDEYDGYAPPSENDDPIYIRAMNDEAEASAQNSSKSTQFDNIDWQSR